LTFFHKFVARQYLRQINKQTKNKQTY
jgi:hypothetical protein